MKTENIIKEEGSKMIGEGLMNNSTLTELNLECKQQYDSFGYEIIWFCEIGNKFKGKGAEMIGEALKTNSTLTSLYLFGDEKTTEMIAKKLEWYNMYEKGTGW